VIPFGIYKNIRDAMQINKVLILFVTSCT
jgi:hypothetical protein